MFSVTVPVSLALTVSEQGEVYAATGADGQPLHRGGPRSGVTVSAVNGWTLVPYDTDMASEKVDSRLLALPSMGRRLRKGTRRPWPDRGLDCPPGRQFAPDL